MDDNPSRLGGSGGCRPMAARWVVSGELRLETAAHFGGEGDTPVDMAILRDPKDGVPLFPGTSLGGALRSHLADVLGGYRSDEPEQVSELFGAARGDDHGAQSPLIVFDSLGKVPEGMLLEIRDGVSIDPIYGTAEPHKKFDFEVLPAGTTFPVRVELVVEKVEEEPRLLGLLATALDGLTSGDIALGMRRSRGLGAVKANHWKAVRHDLTTARGWLGWLISPHEKPIAEDVPGHASAAEAIQAACSTLSIEHFQDKRRRLHVDVQLELVSDLLVRSPATKADAPDVVHLHSAGRPVLPGTGIAGVLRAQALRIARLVRQDHGDGDLWVERLFGPRLETGDGDSARVQPVASRLRIAEAFIEEGQPRKQTRIAIDRFTGGVVSGALFDEQVHSGGKLNLHLELRNPSDADIGLLLLLLKDLLSGELPLGGTVSVGRGLLKGTARVRLPDDEGEYEIGPNLGVKEAARKAFDEKIMAFHEAEPL